jgi:hypothetical protein
MTRDNKRNQVFKQTMNVQYIIDKLQLKLFLKILSVFLLFISMPIQSQTVSNKHEVVTEITIKSTPAKVWNMLTDFANYPEWHPYLKKIVGKPAKGTQIKVTYKKTDLQDGTFSAYILDNEPNRFLSWGGSVGFIFRAKHYYRIESIGNDSVKLIQGEYWRGIFGGMYGKKIYEDTTRKFELMNKKLKDILENKSTTREKKKYIPFDVINNPSFNFQSDSHSSEIYRENTMFG